MAFIRSYQRRWQVDDVGDPGLRGFFRKIKKLKVGRAIGKLGRGALNVARIAAPFVPVPGLSAALTKLTSIGQKFGLSPQQVQTFAAAHGFDLSDIGDIQDIGDPGTKVPKRKRAGSGTKAKSQSKKERKAARVTGKGRNPSGSKRGVDLAAVAKSATSLLPVGRDLADELAKQFGVPGFAAGAAGGGGAALFGRGGRRRINPANVKALNRSLRRVEGFEKLAKRVFANKLFRRVRGGSTLNIHARARGHRAGCGCAVCRRAA